MSLNDVSVVYVRRRQDEDLRDVIALSNRCYDSHATDFLVLDISHDDEALSALARAGDPCRFLSVRATDTASLIELALLATLNEKLIIIDDLNQNISSSTYNGRDVRIVPKPFSP